MKRSLPLIVAAAILLASCGNPFSAARNSKVEDGYRPGAPTGLDNHPPLPQPPQASVGGFRGMKIGPGAVRAAGPTRSAAMTITNDRAFLKGTGNRNSGRFAFSRSNLR